MLRVVVGLDRLAEGDVQIGAPDPVAACRRRLSVAELDRAGAGAAEQCRGVRLQCGGALGIGGEQTAIDAEWVGDERVAEQQRLHLRQRQHAGDGAVALGKGEECAVAERRLDYAAQAAR